MEGMPICWAVPQYFARNHHAIKGIYGGFLLIHLTHKIIIDKNISFGKCVYGIEYVFGDFHPMQGWQNVQFIC